MKLNFYVRLSNIVVSYLLLDIHFDAPSRNFSGVETYIFYWKIVVIITLVYMVIGI